MNKDESKTLILTPEQNERLHRAYRMLKHRSPSAFVLYRDPNIEEPGRWRLTAEFGLAIALDGESEPDHPKEVVQQAEKTLLLLLLQGCGLLEPKEVTEDSPAGVPPRSGRRLDA